MLVEMSLAEMLMNAIGQGRVRGVQFKRGWTTDKDPQTFEDLKAVIGERLDGALRVAREAAYRDAHEQYASSYGRQRVRAMAKLWKRLAKVYRKEVTDQLRVDDRNVRLEAALRQALARLDSGAAGNDGVRAMIRAVLEEERGR